jgi:molecular chaperone DnaJ
MTDMELFRSLTNRQRELLQAYADDVEGKNPHAKSEASSSQKQKPPNNDNGTDSFIKYSPPSGGWISRTWKNIRGLVGL